jgi:hypothetical protein
MPERGQKVPTRSKVPRGRGIDWKDAWIEPSANPGSLVPLHGCSWFISRFGLIASVCFILE